MCKAKPNLKIDWLLSTNHFTARWVSVHGLNHHEMRLLAEKVSDQPETLDTGDKLVEFSLPSWQVRGNESTLKKNLEAWFGPRASPEKNWITWRFRETDF